MSVEQTLRRDFVAYLGADLLFQYEAVVRGAIVKVRNHGEYFVIHAARLLLASPVRREENCVRDGPIP